MASVILVRLTPDVFATLIICIGGHAAQRRAYAEQRCRYEQGLGHALAKDTRRQPEPHFDDEGRGDALERGTITVMSGIDPRHRQVDRTLPQCSGGCDTWIDAKVTRSDTRCRSVPGTPKKRMTPKFFLVRDRQGKPMP